MQTWQLQRFVLVWILILQACQAMFSKRAAPEGLDKMAPCKVLKAELADLFLSNDISAQRAQRIFASAEQRQLGGFRDLAKAGKHVAIRGNISRDLTTTMVRGCGWPGLYNAKIPVWGKKTKAVI